MNLFPALTLGATTMSEANHLLLLLSSGSLGIGIFFGAWTLLGLSHYHENTLAFQYKSSRYNILKEKNSFFKHFFAMVMEWVPRSNSSSHFFTVQRDLPMGEKGVPWEADEYVALIRTEGILVGIATGFFLWVFVHPLASVVGMPLIYYIYENNRVRQLTDSAEKRRSLIRQRLPLFVDLLAISAGAGSTFSGALKIAVQENKEHPVGEEFGEVLHQIDMGMEESKALDSLAQRVAFEPISELIFAVNKANYLGVPLAATLKDIASQMRLKVQQWGEKASAEAQVRIVFPSIIIMVACMIVIISPFILPVIPAVFGN